jgi:uncharacterized protein (DUF1800 family)
MLDYLDGGRNRVGAPNENYARELMELFTLGPVDVNGVENYTQRDVTEMARALTGFGYIDDRNRVIGLRLWAFDDGDKVLFEGMPYEMTGNLGVESADGEPFPPSLNVIDALFAHRDSDGRPTLARFICRKLWEWFAYTDPDLTLVDELADVFVASGYHIGSLVSAILTHDEFYSTQAMQSTPKMPVDFALQALEGLDVKTRYKELPNALEAMGMELFNPPSVNGWNHGVAWLSSSSYLARFEFAQDVAAGRKRDEYQLKPQKLIDRRATTAAEHVDSLLARLGVTVPPASRQALIDYLEGGSQLGEDDWIEIKYRGLLVLLLTLPEFQVH